MIEASWPRVKDLARRTGDAASPAADDFTGPRVAGAEDRRPSSSPDDRRHEQQPGREVQPEPVAVLESFVAGLAACAAPRTVAMLRAGTELTLRRPDRASYRPDGGAGIAGPEIQVWTAEGQPLGRLPPEDAAALDRLAAPGRPVSARVSAVVPAFLRPRVQVRIAFAEAVSAGRTAPDGPSPGMR